MRALVLAAGRFDHALRMEIETAREPRLDVFQLQAELGADLLDYQAVDASPLRVVRVLRRMLGPSAALAYLGLRHIRRYDACFTTGEDVGIPLAALLKASGVHIPHTMIAHTLATSKKRAFFSWLGVQSHIDRILCYSSNEERHMVRRLGIAPEKVRRIRFHADERFFRPLSDVPVEADLVCSAGQLLRDYACLVEAVRDLPVRLCIAAGSPWITSNPRPVPSLPPTVTWRRYDRHALRDLYARSALAVVPIVENDYQTGIATILEMMAMGKCVIATRTRGQTDTIVDGVNGIYVPPSDPAALRASIRRLLERPDEAARIGRAARSFVEAEANLDGFVGRLAGHVRESYTARSTDAPPAASAPA